MKFTLKRKSWRLFFFFLAVKRNPKSDSAEAAIASLITIMRETEDRFCPRTKNPMTIPVLSGWQISENGTYYYNRFNSHIVVVCMNGMIEIYRYNSSKMPLISIDELRLKQQLLVLRKNSEIYYAHSATAN